MSFVDTFKCVHGADRGHTGTRTNSEGAEEEATEAPAINVSSTISRRSFVSRVARRHDVNANQVFYWRKLYREGRLGGSKQLLAVEVTKDRSAPVTEEVSAPSSGRM